MARLPVAKPAAIRLASPPMAKRMSLKCQVCDELVAGFGRDATIAAMAQHVRIRHAELSEACRDELVRRPWWPQPLAEAFVAHTLRAG